MLHVRRPLLADPGQVSVDQEGFRQAGCGQTSLDQTLVTVTKAGSR